MFPDSARNADRQYGNEASKEGLYPDWVNEAEAQIQSAREFIGEIENAIEKRSRGTD